MIYREIDEYIPDHINFDEENLFIFEYLIMKRHFFTKDKLRCTSLIVHKIRL